MLSFHGDPTIKQKYVDRMRQHQEMDDIMQGVGWKYGKGCAVGCTLENYDHDQYEIELGLPAWLAYLEDCIFERLPGLPNKDAKLFPLHFLESIPVGVDVNQIKNPLLIWILESTLDTFDHDKFPECLAAIKNVIELLKKNCTDIPMINNADDARAASASASSASSAASAAVREAYAADAVHAAVCASRAASVAAVSDDDSVFVARVVYDAVRANRSYAAASSEVLRESYTSDDFDVRDSANATIRAACFSAEKQYYKLLADKLIVMLSGCK